MFDQMKQINQMRKQAKEMEAQLAQIKETVSTRSITVTANGNQEIVDIELPADTSHITGQDVLKAINGALKATKKSAAKQMRGKFDIPGLS